MGGGSRNRLARSLIDKALLVARAGRGGNGCASTSPALKGTLFGRPDGGDGGRGGSVVLEAAAALQGFRGVGTHAFGGAGEHGSSRFRHGANGALKTVLVPEGVHVYRVEGEDGEDSEEDSEEAEYSGDSEDEGRNLGHREISELMFLGSLDAPGERMTVARGGSGGHGSAFLGYRQSARGWPGQEVRLMLEMKFLADVGLVGFPNAGKSTLIGALTKVKPEVAPYPFTTMRPFVGRLRFTDGEFIRVADLPGLVQGACEGKGLGFEFLRHVERTSVLCYVVDASLPNAAEQLVALRLEVDKYLQGAQAAHRLLIHPSQPARRSSIVLLNKVDVFDALSSGERSAQAMISQLVQRVHSALGHSCEVFPISAVNKTGLLPLALRLRQLVEEDWARGREERASPQLQWHSR